MEDTARRNALGAMIGLGVAATAGASAAGAKATGPLLAADVDELVSRTRITEVLMAYARANDRVDEALLRSCFWPESTHKHGRFEGTSTDFVTFALKVLTGLKYSAHHISNVSIEVKGNRALSECYYFAHHRRVRQGGGEEDAFFEGRYLDDFERRGGVWKIIHRRGLADYSSPAIPAATLYADWPTGQHSLRAPEDDYYKMLARFRSR